MKRKLPLMAALIVSIGCGDDNGPSEALENQIPPVADFSASETLIETGSTVNFSDASQNASTYEWTFEGGNPATSTSKNQEVTYPEAGTFDVTLKVANDKGEDMETKTGFITVTAQTAMYTVTFQGNWSAANHPDDFPGGDHFSSLIGMVHKEGATLFEEGEPATEGIEDMAELGANTNLRDEIDILVNSGMALSLVNGGGLGGGTEMTSTTIAVNEQFSLVTLVSMIAPSPDWFIAVENVNLFENGSFVETLTVDAISYDSGTDSGLTYSSPNDDTDPAENISRITQAPLGNGTTVDPPAAFVIFTKN